MKRDLKSVNARRAKMLAMIRERQTIKVEELAAHFQVSLMTIRRDLQALEDKGLIGRFYGGATVDSRPAPVSERANRAKMSTSTIRSKHSAYSTDSTAGSR